MTDIGHRGMFVETGEFATLRRNAGFGAIFFRLTRASREEIEQAILEYLDVDRDEHSAAFGWELTYATGRK